MGELRPLVDGCLGQFAFFCIVPVLFIAVMIVMVVRLGFQWKQLLADGVDSTGTVVRKLRFHTRGRTHYIRYEYVDQFGRTHSHKSAVEEDVYNSVEEGQPFPIVYSQSKPHISAPKYLIDLSREAEKKRAAKKAAKDGATGSDQPTAGT